MTVIEFPFEEVSPRTFAGDEITGLMLYGTAVLESDDPSTPSHFRIKTIHLDSRNGTYRLSPTDREKWLYDAICAEIYNDVGALGRAAQDAFDDAVMAEREPDPDRAYEERRDRQMMGHAA